MLPMQPRPAASNAHSLSAYTTAGGFPQAVAHRIVQAVEAAAHVASLYGYKDLETAGGVQHGFGSWSSRIREAAKDSLDMLSISSRAPPGSWPSRRAHDDPGWECAVAASKVNRPALAATGACPIFRRWNQPAKAW